MIGYAADESKRIGRLGGNKQSILVTLGIKEAEVFDICKRNNLLSPVYTTGLFRDGCFFCPNAAKAQRVFIKRNYPLLVEEIYSGIEMSPWVLEKDNFLNNWVEEYKKDKFSRGKLFKMGVK